MADYYSKTTAVWPIFAGANWWLSDDMFTWIRNSFDYSENLEIREDMRSIYPCVLPNINESVNWIPTASTKINDTTFVIWTSTWYIYTYDWTTKTQVVSLWKKILAIEVFAWYVYYSTSDWLYRTQISSSMSWSSSQWKSLTENEYHPLLATDIQLCIWNKNKIDKIVSEVPDDIQDWVILQSSCNIRFLSELWWYVRAVVEMWYNQNEILFWNKVADYAEEIIPMNWYRFYQSIIFNWYHYLVSNKWLWMLNWYQYYIIKRFDKFSDALGWICIHDDKLYIDWTDWIYIYGAKNKNYTEVLGMYYKTTSLWCLCSDWSNILFTKDWYIWLNYWDTWIWVLHTMWYYWSSLSDIKDSQYIRIWYKLWVDQVDEEYVDYLKVYYKTEQKDWTLLGSLAPNSDMRAPFATTLKLNDRFQWIQFKFELKWEDTHLYNANFYYSTILS